MAGDLLHRGPDGTGLYLDGDFGMVSTRLAIVDLAGGDQPISNEDGRYWVVQNGEVYNYVELQDELERLGHRFATHCDTEVLVHAYEEWGEDFLHRLNGDFAIAIWDRKIRELFLARDRFGVRPLFVAEQGGDFCFASEAKALLRHPNAVRRLDSAGIVDTFTLWSVLPDRSAFTGIRELAPGHSLKVGPDGAWREGRWWRPDFRTREETLSASTDELARTLRELLVDATRIRLRADVPVGAYVSGGLDSSAIAALAQDLPSPPPMAFGVTFDDPLFDEGVHQDRMAEQLGIPLERVRVSSADIADALPLVVEQYEKPLLRTAPAPLLLLSRAVRDSGLKVVLTGEGADELFAGYDVFLETKVRRFWAREPDSRIRPLLFGRLYPWLDGDLGRAGAFTGRFFGRGFEDVDDPLYSHRVRFANTSRCLRLLRKEVLDEAADVDPLSRLTAELPTDFDSFTPLGKAQYLEVTTFLESYLLHAQGDRMLMAHSVEGRFPYLDVRVAEFAAGLPDTTKTRGLKEKHLLRKAVEPLLPASIRARRKQPYRAPIAQAFVGPAAPPYVAELLSPRRLDDAGIFSPQAVSRLVRRFETTDAPSETDEMALVGVLSTMLLADRFLPAPSAPVPVEPAKVVDMAEEPVRQSPR